LDHTTASTDIDIPDFQIAGAEVLNVTSAGAAASGGSSQNSIEFGAENTSLTTINISGSSAFAMTMDGGTESFTKAITVDASGLAAVATITLTGNNTDSTITGSAKGDTITGGAGADTIIAGAGNDTINVTSDVDTITTGAGSDTIAFGALTVNATDKAVITDFTQGAGGDKISIAENAVASAALGSLVAGTTTYLEMAVGAIGTNDSSTTQTDDTWYVITDKAFATYDALETELDLENGGTDMDEQVVIFLNSTSGMAELYIDADVGGTTTDEILLAQFSNITEIGQLDDFVAANFVVA
jgi:hypothetical protein